MRRPFLVMRFVLLTLICYFNVLALGFAAWNIAAMKGSDVSVIGAPIFIIFNACIFFFCMFLAFAEVAIPGAGTSHVNFECGWTGVLSALQLGAAIDITIFGPPEFCSSPTLSAVCASATALVPLTWIASLSLLVYFLALLFTAFSHTDTYVVWSISVYSVPWFVEREGPQVPSKAVSGNGIQEASRSAPSSPSSYSNQSEKPSAHLGDNQRPTLLHEESKESLRPTWAKSIKLRRGVDQPFANAPRLTRLFQACWPRSSDSPVPPSPPPKVHLPPLDTNVDLPNNGAFEHPVYQKWRRRSSYGHFPRDVSDPDKPIAFGRLSSWVKADSLTGKSNGGSPV